MGVIGDRRATGSVFTGAFRMVSDKLWMSDGLEFFDVSLWCALSFCARGGDQCRPSDGQLAEMLSVSVPTVQRGLRRLEGASFIDRHYDGEERLITLRPEGDGQAVAYRLRVIAG